jgi:hypothetical protein
LLPADAPGHVDTVHLSGLPGVRRPSQRDGALAQFGHDVFVHGLVVTLDAESELAAALAGVVGRGLHRRKLGAEDLPD